MDIFQEVSKLIAAEPEISGEIFLVYVFSKWLKHQDTLIHVDLLQLHKSCF